MSQHIWHATILDHSFEQKHKVSRYTLIPDIYECLQELYPQEVLEPRPNCFANWAVVNKKVFVVYQKQGDSYTVAGVAFLTLDEAPTRGPFGRIDDVVVRNRFRGNGFGSMLLRCIIEYVTDKKQNLNLSFLVLTSAPERVEANKLYSRVGFSSKPTNRFTLKLL